MLRENSAAASSLQIPATITFEFNAVRSPPLASDSTQARVSWPQDWAHGGRQHGGDDAAQEILDRYRHLRAISARHHSAALAGLARPPILEQAKHLGLAYRQALLAESEEEMTLIFDLAIYTAKPGRSRAIDRYAKTAKILFGSDENSRA